jgi:ABC-type multidrug transport system ATPase subunit
VGITEAFPNEVCVDFDSLGEGLIAIVGENGAGKSTLIGSVFAALFRQLPGQKRSLYDFSTHPQPIMHGSIRALAMRCAKEYTDTGRRHLGCQPQKQSITSNYIVTRLG